MTRWRPLLILLIFIGLIVIVLRFERERREYHSEKAAQKKSPEFFLEKSLTTHYTEEGKIDYQLTSDSLEYFKYSDTANVSQAYFIFYNQDGLSWHSRSDQATIFNSRDEIQLSGNIRIWQPERHMVITTENLLLSDAHSLAKTNDRIVLNSPSGITESTGMEINLDNETLQLLSGVKGKYNPAKPPIVKKSTKGRKKIKAKKPSTQKPNIKKSVYAP